MANNSSLSQHLQEAMENLAVGILIGRKIVVDEKTQKLRPAFHANDPNRIKKIELQDREAASQ